MVRKGTENFTWQDVKILPYKEDDSIFRSITRQTLFQGEGDLGVEWRYFEIGPEGWSTLERHRHQHVVMVIRGNGSVLVGDSISAIGLHDIVHIAPMTWHQFRADQGDCLGFLCVVNCERDRPQRPTDEEFALFDKDIQEFVRR